MASFRVPISQVNITIVRTVLGPYLLILETPSPSFLQTSRQKKNMTTWKWRDLSHLQYGKSDLLSFCVCFSVLINGWMLFSLLVLCMPVVGMTGIHY